MTTSDAWRLILRTIFLLIGLGLLLIFLWHIREIVALVLAACVVAAGVAPVAYRISEFRLGPRGWRINTAISVLIIYVILFVVVGYISSIVFPPIFHNVEELIYATPSIIANLNATIDIQRANYPFIPEFHIDQSLIAQAATQLRSYAPNAFNVVFGFVNSLFQGFFVLVLALYVVVEAPHIRDFVLKLVPRNQRQHVIEVSNEIAWRTGRWVLGQLVLATVVGFSVGLVMLLLGIPYPFALAFIAFVGELIPMVGPIVTGIAMALVALTTSPIQFGLTVAWAILVQQLENNLLVPRIVGSAVGISGLTVILALLIGGSLLGLVGAILAVPVAAALQVLIVRLIEIRDEQEAMHEQQLATQEAGLVVARRDQEVPKPEVTA